MPADPVSGASGPASASGAAGPTLAFAPLPVAWSAPENVGALVSTRQGGCSTGPFDSLNLGDHVGDDPADVAANRAMWGARMPQARPAWLTQVHGAVVVEAAQAARAAREGAQPPQADGSWTAEPGVACVVLVADCLPVLFAALNGRAVGAAHAGWRGLAAGVLERTAEAVAQAAGCPPAELACFLGPCIGPRQFEVGADVLQAFGESERFVSRPRPDGQPRWLADLPGLARDRLQALGLHRVAGGAWCTVEDRSRFFSFRRDGVTGRLAAAVWLRS
jgi:YfiH family protein